MPTRAEQREPKLVVHDAVRSFLGQRPDSVVWSARGNMGSVWRVQIGARAFAIKEASYEVDAAQLQRELRFVDLARDTGVRAPRAVLTDDGSPTVAVTDADGSTRWWRMHEWAVGRHPDIDGKDSLVLAETLGVLHALDVQPDGVAEDWYRVAPLVDWDDLAARGAAIYATWAEQLRRRAQELRDLGQVLIADNPSTDHMCHRDLKRANVLVDEGPLPVLIDWENAGPTSPSRELLNVMFEWFGTDADPSTLSEFLTRYWSRGGVGDPGAPDAHVQLVATSLNYLAGQVTMALDRSVDQPHDRSVDREIHRILDALPDADRLTRWTARWSRV